MVHTATAVSTNVAVTVGMTLLVTNKLDTVKRDVNQDILTYSATNVSNTFLTSFR